MQASVGVGLVGRFRSTCYRLLNRPYLPNVHGWPQPRLVLDNTWDQQLRYTWLLVVPDLVRRASLKTETLKGAAVPCCQQLGFLRHVYGRTRCSGHIGKAVWAVLRGSGKGSVLESPSWITDPALIH